MAEPKLSRSADLKAREAAEALGLAVSTVYKLIARGRLHAVWDRGKVRVPQSAIDSYLADLRDEAA